MPERRNIAIFCIGPKTLGIAIVDLFEGVKQRERFTVFNQYSLHIYII